ncbi:MAG TPA: hypothetical protein VHC97_02290 [Thermoanaerobaculia bacterium]|jgi:hypothetical protein|nr:hypothetical protein [Thermoanaerobaculia bacterium]
MKTVNIDRLVLTGLDLSDRQAEGLRQQIAAELQERIVQGSEGKTGGEVRTGAHLAGDVADRIAGALRRQR